MAILHTTWALFPYPRWPNWCMHARRAPAAAPPRAPLQHARDGRTRVCADCHTVCHIAFVSWPQRPYRPMTKPAMGRKKAATAGAVNLTRIQKEKVRWVVSWWGRCAFSVVRILGHRYHDRMLPMRHRHRHRDCHMTSNSDPSAPSVNAIAPAAWSTV